MPSRGNETTDAIPLPSGENEPIDRKVTVEEQSSNEGPRKSSIDHALQEQHQGAGVPIKLDDMEPGGGLNDNEMPPIAAVPPDFLFNKLLMDIENSISRDELQKLKSMLKGKFI